MKNFKYLFFYLFFFTYSAFSLPVEKVSQKIDSYIQNHMQEWSIPGLSMAIIKGNDVIFKKTYGVKRSHSHDPITEKTVFQIASLTKAFTVLLLAKLVEEGVLKWDDPVIKYLPEFKLRSPKLTQRITIRDLVSHRSGLPPFTGDTFWATGASQLELLDFISKITPVKTFREDHTYQNVLFGLAGIVAQRATQKSIEELYQEYILTPLEIQDGWMGVGRLDTFLNPSFSEKIKRFFRGFFSEKSPALDFATPHGINRYQEVMAKRISDVMYRFPSTSGLNLSLNDGIRLAKMYLNQGMLSQESWLELSNPLTTVTLSDKTTLFHKERIKKVQYGMGRYFYTFEINGKKIKVEGHHGAYMGNRSLFFMIPDQKIAVILFCNLGGLRANMFPEAVRAQFMDYLYDAKGGKNWSHAYLKNMEDLHLQRHKAFQKMRYKNPRPHTEFKKLQGTYTNPLYGDLKLGVLTGKLGLYYRHHYMPLKHWNGDTFRFHAPDLSPAYIGRDKAYVEIGYDKKSGKRALYVNLLNEGDNPVFCKQDEG